MPCIEIPELSYLYGYLLVSAWVHTHPKVISILPISPSWSTMLQVLYNKRMFVAGSCMDALLVTEETRTCGKFYMGVYIS